MLPLKRVIAPASRSSNVALASSRLRRSCNVRMLRARTDAKPGGLGDGFVGPFLDAVPGAAKAISRRSSCCRRKHGAGGRGFQAKSYRGAFGGRQPRCDRKICCDP